MMGKPKTWLGKAFGPTGKYVKFIWRYVAPLEAMVGIHELNNLINYFQVVFYVVLDEQLGSTPSYGKFFGCFNSSAYLI
jgi:hypothetical protein